MSAEDAPQFNLEKADQLTDKIRNGLNSGEISIDEANRLQGIIGEQVRILVNPDYAAHVATLEKTNLDEHAKDPLESEEYFKS